MSETINLEVLKPISKFIQQDTSAIHEEPRSSLNSWIAGTIQRRDLNVLLYK